jgi:hypothetical protein
MLLSRTSSYLSLVSEADEKSPKSPRSGGVTPKPPSGGTSPKPNLLSVFQRSPNRRPSRLLTTNMLQIPVPDGSGGFPGSDLFTIHSPGLRSSSQPEKIGTQQPKNPVPSISLFPADD